MNNSIAIGNVSESQISTTAVSKSFILLFCMIAAMAIGITIYYATGKTSYPSLDTTTDIDWSNPPCSPDELSKDWKETTNPNMVNRREFVYKNTGNKISFEKGNVGKEGFKEIDPWHRYNPNSTNKQNIYLDSNGNPVGKGSRPSHIETNCK